MSRLATAYVLGYHGCEAGTAEKAINGEIELLQSEKSYDWLGPGVYFWQSDPQRAMEWAEARKYAEPAVVGAAIDLRNCLDLLNLEDIELVRSAHASFLKTREKAGLPMPKNEAPESGREEDRVLRRLDCAVLRHLHEIIERRNLEPYDTVRAMFREGDALYEAAAFTSKRTRRSRLGIWTAFWGFSAPDLILLCDDPVHVVDEMRRGEKILSASPLTA